MGVVLNNVFRTESGKLASHMASTAEALGHLRRLGLAAMSLQPISGSDIGTIVTSINFANNADYASGLQRVQADPGWQEFWGGVTAAPSAVQVESSIFTDVDPGFSPSADRPLGVILGTQWRARPGRMMDFMGNVMTSMAHVERMGGLSRPMNSLVGAHPMTTLVATSFADLDAYGAYADATATDPQWLEFWGGVMADPTADLIRSGVYMNVSGD